MLGEERRYTCQLQTGLITDTRLVFKTPSSSAITFGAYQFEVAVNGEASLPVPAARMPTQRS